MYTLQDVISSVIIWFSRSKKASSNSNLFGWRWSPAITCSVWESPPRHFFSSTDWSIVSSTNFIKALDDILSRYPSWITRHVSSGDGTNSIDGGAGFEDVVDCLNPKLLKARKILAFLRTPRQWTSSVDENRLVSLPPSEWHKPITGKVAMIPDLSLAIILLYTLLKEATESWEAFWWFFVTRGMAVVTTMQPLESLRFSCYMWVNVFRWDVSTWKRCRIISNLPAYLDRRQLEISRQGSHRRSG